MKAVCTSDTMQVAKDGLLWNHAQYTLALQFIVLFYFHARIQDMLELVFLFKFVLNRMTVESFSPHRTPKDFCLDGIKEG